MSRKFRKYLWISFGLHAAAILIMVLSPSFYLREPPATKVTWIRLSFGDGGQNKKAHLKKLDKLPDASLKEQREALKKQELLKTLQETKDAKKLEVPKITVDKTEIKIGQKKETPKVEQNKTRSRVDEALAKIDEQLKKREDEILQIKKADIGVAQAKDDETGQSPFGSSESNITDPALITYYNLLKRKIKQQWILAERDFDSALIAQIIVMIDNSGQITQTWFKKASGDGSFDDSALRAIKKSAPFPSPPESIRKEAITEGFLIEFNPKTVTGQMNF